MSSGIAFPLWYTRCPVPTASGLAYAQGWLSRRYAHWGAHLGVLQDAPAEIARHHYDHALPGLIREGGSVPAIVARASGAPTRLIGLTWIEERQVLVGRPDTALAQIGWAGLRLAIPGWASQRHASHHRAMALAGFESVLRHAGLSLGDAVQVEVPVGATVPPGHLRQAGGGSVWVAVTAVARGLADAAYVKGSAGLAAARQAGLVILADLADLPGPRWRINNGTPRPLTVHEELLQYRPEWVVAFLEESLRAADWAQRNPSEVLGVLQAEAGGDPEDVATAYGQGLDEGFAPSLDAQRLEWLSLQVDFLARHDFLQSGVDVHAWVAPEPLLAAQAAVKSLVRAA